MVFSRSELDNWIFGCISNKKLLKKFGKFEKKILLLSCYQQNFALIQRRKYQQDKRDLKFLYL